MRGPTAKQLAPLSGSGFRLLFLSTLGSSIGTLFAAIALAIDVKQRTDSGLWVGAVLIVEFLPTIVVGLTLGPLVDRLDRRTLMIGADLVRAAVFCILPFTTSAAGIVALALVAGLATGIFRPAVYAGVPNLVPPDQLPEANALLQTIENLSWAIGPVLGGILTAAAGPDAAYWINAASFFVSALLVARIPRRLLQSETALSRGHWHDLADGFVAVIRSRPLLAVLVAWSIASLGIGAISLIEVFMATNTLHAGDWGYGLLYGGIGTGLVIGSWFSSSIVERFGTTRAYTGALVHHGNRLRRGGDRSQHLGGGGVLRRRWHRRRPGDRLQCAARPARRRRSRPRTCADVRDERDLHPERRRHGDRRRVAARDRAPLDLGRRRRLVRARRDRGVRPHP